MQQNELEVTNYTQKTDLHRSVFCVYSFATMGRECRARSAVHSRLGETLSRLGQVCRMVFD